VLANTYLGQTEKSSEVRVKRAFPPTPPEQWRAGKVILTATLQAKHCFIARGKGWGMQAERGDNASHSVGRRPDDGATPALLAGPCWGECCPRGRLKRKAELKLGHDRRLVRHPDGEPREAS